MKAFLLVGFGGLQGCIRLDNIAWLGLQRFRFREPALPPDVHFFLSTTSREIGDKELGSLKEYNMPLRLSSLRSKKPRHGRAVSGASEAEEYPTASPSTSASFASLAVDDMDAPEEEEEDERPYGIAEWAAGENPEIE